MVGLYARCGWGGSLFTVFFFTLTLTMCGKKVKWINIDLFPTTFRMIIAAIFTIQLLCSGLCLLSFSKPLPYKNMFSPSFATKKKIFFRFRRHFTITRLTAMQIQIIHRNAYRFCRTSNEDDCILFHSCLRKFFVDDPVVQWYWFVFVRPIILFHKQLEPLLPFSDCHYAHLVNPYSCLRNNRMFIENSKCLIG